jgi:hypothetical protein
MVLLGHADGASAPLQRDHGLIRKTPR